MLAIIWPEIEKKRYNKLAKFQPSRVDAHAVEILCLQHTLARLSLILRKLRLPRLSTLPC